MHPTRSSVSLAFVLLLCGCGTPEERACAHTIELFEASNELPRFNEDGKGRVKHQRDCVESLRRLRAELHPDEDQWFAYLRCLRAAPDMPAQFDCLGPLSAAQTEAIEQSLGPAPQN